MSSHDGWKSTPAGRCARFVGGVKFAVPLLALAAAAMAWGTWVDSTEGRVAAASKVYGSWWFITLMLLICASLILSVAVRYPWRRKHVGFIIVHASMVALIAIGFYTMYTKVEGRIVLDEGESADRMLMDQRWVELVEHTDQGFQPLAYAVLDGGVEIRLDNQESGVAERVKVEEVWANSEEASYILNDGQAPLHAVEIITAPGQAVGDWVGQMEATEPAARFEGFELRVVPTGQVWTPPTGGTRAVFLDAASTEWGIPEPGDSLADGGWTVTSVEFFERATIGAGGVTERENGPPNPAVRVVLTHTDGSVEQQMAFERFRDSPFTQQLEGATASGLSLTYRGEAFTEPTLAVMRDEDGRVHAVYAEPGGSTASYANDGTWPWAITVAGKPVTILQDFDRARLSKVLEERPGADPSSPAIVVSAPEGGERAILRWNTPTPLQVGDRTIMLRYGPVTRQLPFAIKLVDFRKSDYPGSQMAMAYESDVLVSTGAGAPADFRIHMNHPYKQAGWKVYQSGFLGDTVTVFQVTKDPGLVPMYLACTTLCIGILVTFYSRSLSWGHPDIPVPFPPSAPEKA